MNPAYPFDLACGKKSGLSFGRDTEMRVILKEEIIQKLREVGLEKGDAVMVHTSLKRMGYVCGGAQTVIEALMEVVGKDGTIMMPTQSWKR
jgi:aminoglycoside 3-N-acetyltransferase